MSDGTRAKSETGVYLGLGAALERRGKDILTVIRALIALATLVLSLSIPHLADASEIGTRSGEPAACASAPDGSAVSATNQSPSAGSATEVALERAPDPETAPPRTSSPLVPGVPVISQTVRTYIEDGLTHTVRSTVQYLASPSATQAASGSCSKTGRYYLTDDDTICGGGCLTQWQRRTIDSYTNSGDPTNIYWDRIEVRLWWVRQYDIQIGFAGNAYTEWREDALNDCNGTPVGRTTWSSWLPQWANQWQTYEYYWDETWLPTAAAPDFFHLVVDTTTPTTYGPNLYTVNKVD